MYAIFISHGSCGKCGCGAALWAPVCVFLAQQGGLAENRLPWSSLAVALLTYKESRKRLPLGGAPEPSEPTPSGACGPRLLLGCATRAVLWEGASRHSVGDGWRQGRGRDAGERLSWGASPLGSAVGSLVHTDSPKHVWALRASPTGRGDSYRQVRQGDDASQGAANACLGLEFDCQVPILPPVHPVTLCPGTRDLSPCMRLWKRVFQLCTRQHVYAGSCQSLLGLTKASEVASVSG